jgi:hypothetical protein
MLAQLVVLEETQDKQDKPVMLVVPMAKVVTLEPILAQVEVVLQRQTLRFNQPVVQVDQVSVLLDTSFKFIDYYKIKHSQECFFIC